MNIDETYYREQYAALVNAKKNGKNLSVDEKGTMYWIEAKYPHLFSEFHN